MPDQMSNIFIMPKKWCEKHNALQPQNFKEKQEMYTVRNANGSGPFKLELREPDIKTILVKNPKGWGLSQTPHNVDRIIYTPIANAATRVAAFSPERWISCSTHPSKISACGRRSIWPLISMPSRKS
jgi:peptide/nickel transport system substrate-binding protein